MPGIRRFLCVSFVLSLAVSLHAAVTGVAINIDGKPVSGAKVSLFAPELIAPTAPRLMSADPQRKPLATSLRCARTGARDGATCAWSSPRAPEALAPLGRLAGR